jgi:hypothetical protein
MGLEAVSAFLIDISYQQKDGAVLLYRGQFYARDSVAAISSARDYAITYLRPASILSIAQAQIIDVG